ncbi:hypothetical protein GLYMA_08G248750v4 [Glycine max]|nr:hypothetical protein GLYMA_08G248750v4 [Glycine max]KAH1052968.1 hypothetical protein GYH30_022315 [Glycine max]
MFTIALLLLRGSFLISKPGLGLDINPRSFSLFFSTL